MDFRKREADIDANYGQSGNVWKGEQIVISNSRHEWLDNPNGLVPERDHQIGESMEYRRRSRGGTLSPDTSSRGMRSVGMSPHCGDARQLTSEVFEMNRTSILCQLLMHHGKLNSLQWLYWNGLRTLWAIGLPRRRPFAARHWRS